MRGWGGHGGGRGGRDGGAVCGDGIGGWGWCGVAWGGGWGGEGQQYQPYKSKGEERVGGVRVAGTGEWGFFMSGVSVGWRGVRGGCGSGLGDGWR